MKVIVERNPFEVAPMEPFWITTVRFLGRTVICVALISVLAIALNRLS